MPRQLVPVDTTTSTPVTITPSAAAHTNEGSVAFGGISGSYATLLAPGGNAVIVLLQNQTNVSLVFSLNGGTNNFITIPTRGTATIDLGTNGRYSSGTISVKHAGVAPASGSAYASVIR